MEKPSLKPCEACGGTLTVKEEADEYVYGKCENKGCSSAISFVWAEGFLSRVAGQGRTPTVSVATDGPFPDGRWVHMGLRSL